MALVILGEYRMATDVSSNCCAGFFLGGRADHIWSEKNVHRTLWDEAEIIDKEHDWKIRKHKKLAHILGHRYLLSRPSKEMNTIWAPIIQESYKKITIKKL